MPVNNLSPNEGTTTTPHKNTESCNISDEVRLAHARKQAREETEFVASPGGDSEDAESPRTRSPSDPSPPAAIRPPSKHSRPFSFPVIILLVPSSMFGLLARLGLEGLTKYDGQSLFSLAWVQAVGCLIMGVAVGLREPISQFYAPLYFALATGFCGSLTTFATWNLQVFQTWENAAGHHRVWLYDIIDGLSQIGATLAISLSSLVLGIHIAELILPAIPLKLPKVHAPVRAVIFIFSGLAYALAIVFYFVLPHSYRAKATAALLFAFPGAFLRHAVSVKLNPWNKSFPMGTFTVNILATALVGMFHVLQRRRWHEGQVFVDPFSCTMLQALQDGLCGCLSTVSTFAVEIRALRKMGWRYVGASVGVAQLVLIVLMGVPWWSGAVEEGAICSYE